MIGQEEVVLRDFGVPTVRARPESISFEETERVPGIREERRKRKKRKANDEEDILLPMTQR
jgi:hypothetical protein